MNTIIVPMQPPPNFLAPHPASIVLKNPFIIFNFLVSVKISTVITKNSYIINSETYNISNGDLLCQKFNSTHKRFRHRTFACNYRKSLTLFRSNFWLILNMFGKNGFSLSTIALLRNIYANI